MGKMKALSLDIEENHAQDQDEQQQEQQEKDVVFLQQEAHYYHTINGICDLFVLHGWDKVWPDIQDCMRGKKW